MTDGYSINSNSILQSTTDISSFCEKIFAINGFENGNKITKDSISEGEIESTFEYGLKVIITIPAYNEEDTIANVINQIKETMDQTKYCYNYAILVVNDGSDDKTTEIATKAGAHVFSHSKNLGLAESFRTEMKLCCELGAEIIVHTDADGQYQAQDIPKLIEQVENGYDLVLGSRFKGTIEKMSNIKRFGNHAFSFIISLLTGEKISDGQTGFRAFNRKIAENLPIISTHTYTQEQIIRASKMNLKIQEIPIHFAKRTNGESRLIRSPFEYAIRAWQDIFRIYFKH